MAGNSLFCAGSVVQSASLIPGFDLRGEGMSAWPTSAAAAKANALNQILTLDSGLTLIQSANKVRQDAITLNSLLTGAGAAAVSTVFPGTPWPAIAAGGQDHQSAAQQRHGAAGFLLFDRWF